MSITPSLTEPTLLSQAYQHYSKLLRRAINLTRNITEAEDLVHDTFLKAHQGQTTYTEQGNLESWLMTILRNLHLDMVRRKKYRRTIALDDGLSNFKIALSPSDNTAPGSMVMDDARIAIQNLPVRMREAMELYLYQEEKYEDIAAIQGVALGTVKSQISKARRYLATRNLGEYAATIEGSKKLKKFSVPRKL